jgi:hypothetical protein
LDSGGRGQLRREPLRELPRLAPQPLRQIEGGGEGQVSQLDAWRVLERDVVEGDAEGPIRRLADSLREALLCLEHHNVQF